MYHATAFPFVPAAPVKLLTNPLLQKFCGLLAVAADGVGFTVTVTELVFVNVGCAAHLPVTVYVALLVIFTNTLSYGLLKTGVDDANAVPFQ